jgi:hypothetical protein
MALSNHDESTIRDYLLGKLTEEDQQKVEERLMVEDELFDEFEVSKGELVEEYVAGELPPKEHDWFRTHFLASPEGRQSHAFVLAVQNLRAPAPAPIAQVTATQSWWQRLRSFLTTRTWTIGLATSALAVALFAWLLIPGGGVTSIGPTLVGTVIQRSGQGELPVRLKIDPKASKFRIRLLLPKPAIPATSYRANLDDRLRTSAVNVVERDADGVWIEIPTELIPPGEYSLQLTAVKADGSEEKIPRYYYFNVER